MDHACLVYTSWNATMMVQTREDDRCTMVPFGQGFKDMSPPTKELMRIVLEHKLCHGGHPLCADCLKRGTTVPARVVHNTVPPKATLKCPAWLLPEAKKEWKRLAPALEAMGVLTMACLLYTSRCV